MTTSPFEIRFTTEEGLIAILASEGDSIENPSFEGDQGMYELDGIELDNAYFRPIGNATVKITIEVEVADDALHDSFLDAEMAAAAMVDLVGVGGVLSFIRGESVTEYPNAVVQNVRPGLPLAPEPVVTRVFTIIASLPDLGDHSVS